jgi:signal transduction histidine kinase
MFNTSFNKSANTSLIGEYTSLLGEAKLRQRTRSAERDARIERELANKVKSEFISNMSHELRTPLNTVLGFSRILSEHGERKIPDAEVVDYATMINDAASHLLSVINDILDISKIQSGKYSLDTQDVNVSEVLSLALAAENVTAAEHNVSVETNIPGNLSTIKGDAKKLGQALTNLISNAIRFSDPGGKILVSAAKNHSRGLTIVITDEGCGMTDKELQVAITPFGQVDGSKTRMHEGTGLGLSIAKSLIELHGGELKIQSIKGQGTTVTVILPPPHQVSLARAREFASTGGNST